MSDLAGHAFADQLAKALELAGVGIIIGGVLLATSLFLREGVSARRWSDAFESYRSNLGRGILLGLELLVGADIISTITAPLTAQSVSLLAGIVAIRTFLSFSLETEIEGCWPWRRAQRDAAGTRERVVGGPTSTRVDPRELPRREPGHRNR